MNDINKKPKKKTHTTVPTCARKMEYELRDRLHESEDFFRHEAIVGNIGITIGVAAPMAFFPFRGWKDSFFGDLHAQGRHGIEFFTQTKVVVERWPSEWSRQF